MGVVFNLAQNLIVAPAAVGGQGDFQNRIDMGATPALCEFRLHRHHVDLVVVQRVQGGGGGRGHPSAVGPGLGVVDLLFQHGGHQVGHGPHALADLGAA